MAANNSDTISRHYATLSGEERSLAVLEAMARRDTLEEQRLDDSCPRRVYEMDDPTYRRRLDFTYKATAMVCLSLLRDLDAIRMIQVFGEVVEVFRDWCGETAEDALLAGWRGAQSELAGEASPEATDEAKTPVDVDPEEGSANEESDDYRDDDTEEAEDLPRGPRTDDPELEAELELMRAAAAEPMNRALRAVRIGAGQHRASALLSAWEGLGRFSRECVGVEPLVLTRAWRLLEEDPTAEVVEMYPEAKPIEASVAGWHNALAGTWRRHFEVD